MSKYCYKITKHSEQLPDCQTEMDVQLVVSKKDDIYHSYELYSDDMSIFFEELNNNHPVNIILTGFLQEHIEAILPYLKDVRALCLFKCQKLDSFDFVSKCKALEYIEIYWNKKATELWDVKENKQLRTLIITSCNKLNDFALLKKSSIQHLEIWGCNYLSSFSPKAKIEDLSVFQTMPNLEVLRLAIIKNDNREKDLADLSKLT